MTLRFLRGVAGRSRGGAPMGPFGGLAIYTWDDIMTWDDNYQALYCFPKPFAALLDLILLKKIKWEHSSVYVKFVREPTI